MKSIVNIPLPLAVSPEALKLAVNALHGDDIGYSLMEDSSKAVGSIKVRLTALPETIDAIKACPVTVETEDGPVSVLVEWVSDIEEAEGP